MPSNIAQKSGGVLHGSARGVIREWAGCYMGVGEVLRANVTFVIKQSVFYSSNTSDDVLYISFIHNMNSLSPESGSCGTHYCTCNKSIATSGLGRSTLHYCNSPFHNIALKGILKLQHGQHICQG